MLHRKIQRIAIIFSALCYIACTQSINTRSSKFASEEGEAKKTDPVAGKEAPLIIDRYEEVSRQLASVNPKVDFEKFKTLRSILLSTQQRLSLPSSLPLMFGEEVSGTFEVEKKHDHLTGANQVLLQKKFGGCEVFIKADSVTVSEETAVEGGYLPLGRTFESGSKIGLSNSGLVISGLVHFSFMFSDAMQCAAALKSKKTVLGSISNAKFIFQVSQEIGPPRNLSTIVASQDKAQILNRTYEIQLDWTDPGIVYLRGGNNEHLLQMNIPAHILPNQKAPVLLGVRLN